MTLRRVLCPLLGSEADIPSLALSFTVARDLCCHLDVVFVRPDPSESLPYLGDGMSGTVVSDILQSAKKAGEEAAKTARLHFEQAARDAGVEITDAPAGPGRVSAKFGEKIGRLAEEVAIRSRLCDLVIFPDGAWDESPSLLFAFEAALMSSGRPIMLAPRGQPIHSFGAAAVIAWDGSVEAAHALSASMPFLSKASQIEIVTVNAPTATATLMTDDLMAYLAIHGLKATLHKLDSKGNPVGLVLLDFSADVGASLLVMGGYGHSRLRELILGGTTKRILSNARMPIFIAH